MLTCVAGHAERLDLAISIDSKIEVSSVRAGCLVIAFFWRMGKAGF